MTTETECLYNVDELAKRAGVSRRTVRYYIQRGLLPPPSGLGRGKHYTKSHLATLTRIRELQEDSVPLEVIAERLAGLERKSVSEPNQVQTTWIRVELAEDIELHLRSRRLTEEQVSLLSMAVKKWMGDIES